MRSLVHSLRMIVATAFAAALAFSCVYPFDAKVEGGGGIISIEGDILAGDWTTVLVTGSQALATTDLPPLIDATVYVESRNGQRKNAVRVEAGTGDFAEHAYYLIDTRKLDVSQQCRLVVVIEGTTYACDWQDIRRTSQVDSLSYQIAEDREWMDICVSAHGEADGGYYRWIGREVYEYKADFQATVYFDPAADSVTYFADGANYYYCWMRRSAPDIMTASTLQMEQDRLVDYPVMSINCRDERISYYYKISLIQESISEDAWRYWNNIARNSSEVGGLFSPQPSEIRGNIHNLQDTTEYVIGYISASQVSEARIMIPNHATQFYVAPEGFPEVPKLVRRNEWNKYYHELDWWPYRMYFPPDPDGGEEPDPSEEPDDGSGVAEYTWLPHRCVDCRSKGGTKRKPADWPTIDI